MSGRQKVRARKRRQRLAKADEMLKLLEGSLEDKVRAWRWYEHLDKPWLWFPDPQTTMEE